MTAAAKSRKADETDSRGLTLRIVDTVAAVFTLFVRGVLFVLGWAALLFSSFVAVVLVVLRRGGGMFSTLARLARTAIAWTAYLVFFVAAAFWELVDALYGEDASLDPGAERKPANEDYHIDRISADVLDKMRADYARGMTRRDAHPKHHGLLKACFEVVDDVPQDLQVGLFATPGKKFDAWVRLSNASHSMQPDAVPDVRGFAIKLCNARAGSSDITSSPDHDLLLISEPVFLTHTVAQFSYFQRALIRRSKWHGLWGLYAFVAPWRLYIYRNLSRIYTRRHRSLLNIDYHSATPYALGDCRAVRYRLRPRTKVFDDKVDRSVDFLRHGLRRQLQNDDVTFEFLVQRQRSSRWQPIERPGRAWWDWYAPPELVATLTLPKQCFDTAEQMRQAEHITYTPWNALPEHRPLGGINRAREIVYRRTASFRHERNEVERERPTCEELEETWSRYNP